MAGEHHPALSGSLTGGVHCLSLRIYYEDTDFSGFVYHAAYLRFMDRGRTDCLRLIGIQHGDLRKGTHGVGVAFVLRHMEVDFRSPAAMDDLLEIETRVERFSGVRLVLAQRVLRGGETLVTARVTVVVVNEQGRPHRLPGTLSDRLVAGS